MGSFRNNGHRFRGPMAKLVLAFACRRIGYMPGRNICRRLFRIKFQFLRPPANLRGWGTAFSAENLRKRGVVSFQEGGKGTQGVARVALLANSQLLLQSRSELPLLR